MDYCYQCETCEGPLDEGWCARCAYADLRAALEEIAEYPSSQPAALNMPEDRWQARRAQDMQGIAWRALNKAE